MSRPTRRDNWHQLIDKDFDSRNCYVAACWVADSVIDTLRLFTPNVKKATGCLSKQWWKTCKEKANLDNRRPWRPQINQRPGPTLRNTSALRQSELRRRQPQRGSHPSDRLTPLSTGIDVGLFGAAWLDSSSRGSLRSFGTSCRACSLNRLPSSRLGTPPIMRSVSTKNICRSTGFGSTEHLIGFLSFTRAAHI